MIMKRRISKYLFIALILALLLSVAGLSACAKPAPAPAPEPLRLFVPQRADLVARVEIEQILNDGDFAYLYRRFAEQNAGMPRTVNEALDQVENETGIDPRDFKQAVAFAHTSELVQFMNSPYPGGPYWGALLKGSFAEKRMILTIAGQFGREFENYTYKGAKIYTFTEGREVLFSFTFVNNELIVVGSTRAVEDTIDVMGGDYEPISGVVYDLYESLGQVFLKMAFSVPTSISREIPATQNIDDLHLTLRPLRDVNIVGWTFDKIGSTIITEVQLHFDYTDSAQEIAELVDNLIAVGKLIVPDPKLKRYLDNVETTSYGSVFSLRVTETIDDIEDLMYFLMD